MRAAIPAERSSCGDVPLPNIDPDPRRNRESQPCRLGQPRGELSGRLESPPSGPWPPPPRTHSNQPVQPGGVRVLGVPTWLSSRVAGLLRHRDIHRDVRSGSGRRGSGLLGLVTLGFVVLGAACGGSGGNTAGGPTSSASFVVGSS